MRRRPLTLVATGRRPPGQMAGGQLPERSRSEVQRWIEAGLVSAGSRPQERTDRAGAVVIPAADVAVEPEPIPLDILYQDADLLVINKPAGMVVHPAAGNWHGTLVNAVLYHCPDLEGVGGAHRPGIVHRWIRIRRASSWWRRTMRRIGRCKHSSRHARCAKPIGRWCTVCCRLRRARSSRRSATIAGPQAHGGGAERGPTGGHTL